MTKWRDAVLVAAIVGILSQTLPAAACSCVEEDLRDALERSDGAIVGTLLERRPATDENGQPDPWIYVFTFRVDEALKGEFAETVEVRGGSDGASCGLSAEEGQQLGLLMSFDESDGTWGSGLCSQTSPEELRKAAAPLPAPDGRGRARLLVGGSWGESSYMALDARGRTLGYGLGDESGARLEVCPGARRFLEVYRRNRGWTIAVRDTATNQRAGKVSVVLGEEARDDTTMPAVTCGGPRGRTVFFAVAAYGGGRGRVVAVRGGDRDVSYSGRLDDVVFAGDGTAFLQRGREIAALDLSSGRLAPVVTFRSRPYLLELSPNGARLATFLGRDVVVVDLGDGTRRRHDLPREYAEVGWMDRERLVLFPHAGRGRVTVLGAGDGRARPISGDWYAFTSVVSGRFAFGLGYRELYRVGLPDGRVELVRSFDSPFIESIAAVTPPTDVEWPPSE